MNTHDTPPRKRMEQVTQADRETFRTMWGAGKTIFEIARTLNITLSVADKLKPHKKVKDNPYTKVVGGSNG